MSERCLVPVLKRMIRSGTGVEKSSGKLKLPQRMPTIGKCPICYRDNSVDFTHYPVENSFTMFQIPLLLPLSGKYFYVPQDNSNLVSCGLQVVCILPSHFVVPLLSPFHQVQWLLRCTISFRTSFTLANHPVDFQPHFVVGKVNLIIKLSLLYAVKKIASTESLPLQNPLFWSPKHFAVRDAWEKGMGWLH